MNSSFPFQVNSFYRKKEIWRTLGVAGLGGIRPNRIRNFVAVFFNAPDLRARLGRSHNIYADFYNPSTGLFRYTGEGQKGDQKLSRGNLWLANAAKNRTKIHLFKQQNAGGLHEYLGEMKVVSYDTEVQKDVYGNQRTVFVFLLRPMSTTAVSEDDATEREIDFELEKRKKLIPSRNRLEKELEALRKLIARRGPEKRTLVTRSESEYRRFKRVVVVLKMIYSVSCQICGYEHFETEKGVYSEVHHLLPWSVTHDDAPENLVVLCANCHRKLHHAKAAETNRMHGQLIDRFPHIQYRQPRPRNVN